MKPKCRRSWWALTGSALSLTQEPWHQMLMFHSCTNKSDMFWFQGFSTFLHVSPVEINLKVQALGFHDWKAPDICAGTEGMRTPQRCEHQRKFKNHNFTEVSHNFSMSPDAFSLKWLNWKYQIRTTQWFTARQSKYYIEWPSEEYRFATLALSVLTGTVFFLVALGLYTGNTCLREPYAMGFYLGLSILLRKL